MLTVSSSWSGRAVQGIRRARWRLITGQQQYSARKVAEMLIEALGI
jgi:hypothetical protein